MVVGTSGGEVVMAGPFEEEAVEAIALAGENGTDGASAREFVALGVPMAEAVETGAPAGEAVITDTSVGRLAWLALQ